MSQLERTQTELVKQERFAAVGQLAAGIAHDFNNILTAMMGQAEVMQMSPHTPSDMQSKLQSIRSSGQRAAQLVRQLLDFSRKSFRQPIQIDLSILVEDIIEQEKRVLSDSIHLNLTVTPGNYQVNADPVQLQHVVTNLVNNARDAIPTGGKIRIELTRAKSSGQKKCVICGQVIEGEWIRLSVTDSGDGIPPDILAHIFEPFFTTKEVGQGTGLGLSQVYGIVSQHTGHITVSSQVGSGTTVTIYLPSGSKQSAPATIEPLSDKRGRWN